MRFSGLRSLRSITNKKEKTLRQEIEEEIEVEKNFIEQTLGPGTNAVLAETMISAYDFINWPGFPRNIFNWSLFSDNGISNPTFLVYSLQDSLNKALVSKDLRGIGVDGYFGVGSATGLQRLINYHLKEILDYNTVVSRVSKVKELLEEDGKIVSKIDTSLAFGEVLVLLERNHNEFLKILFEVIKHYGHIQQQGRLILGLYPADHSNKPNKPVVDV